MSLIKRGTSSSAAVVASSVYACESCDHVKIVSGASKGSMHCPKCSAMMKMISCQCAADVQQRKLKPNCPSCDKQ